jgi:hypothetical protein
MTFPPPTLDVAEGNYHVQIIGFDFDSPDPNADGCRPVGAPPDGKYAISTMTLKQENGWWVARSSAVGDDLVISFRQSTATASLPFVVLEGMGHG